MEGSVIFALSGALMGEISFKDGAVEQSSFDDYPLLRITQSPKIVVSLIDSDRKHSGVGEPGVPPVAASITNAIVAAGGPRIRDLPINRHLKLA
jgi:isoquinoline 1-oxidoreductase beta subunit